ncbi:hypothetical protein GIB67_004652 [Kingdonia uniflora]|uniref:Kinesin motor domain-containing protein n=1 Tax=Kingdonia uniflora TaxID=39325 RepID=A0A7J7MD46_9MAGN|nr:hypothetical protein GIB67_004652 [Kingdonia uniflora]
MSPRSSSTISAFLSRRSPTTTTTTPSSSSKKTGARPTTHSSSSRLPLKLSPANSTSPSISTTNKAKENVTVTVRFRPLSDREINKGDEIAWYADGDYTVRNEFNSSTAYAFDRVFGPATTTRHVYDAAAQNVVNGAMEGINGTVFAYGVTSSGKTHTMHGEQKSPGIIPLAVKDVFSIIQETPGREFLLRVSYLEIYNEVINDLLDPAGQNLKIREDSQGTYVEGIKEEVVLSPAHALSLIASGEEHRHVGSNNFNLLSSRSHTIFTLTIESGPRGEDQGEEDVTLSQLNLIDLAGSESSKAETTGLRRKEGSYINKSLLTLGTVISKLTDDKATHIPYRDSKLTRLLQYSLSGYGRVSLICTVTPASSNSEETHNTLKFAHRSKHMEIRASQNKIMDEKSLIKKYQKEISSLKSELEQLKRGIMEKPHLNASNQEDFVNLKLQLEAGQVKLQSRLEEEEQAKAALMGRIQRLTKLILVSTKNSISSSVPGKPDYRRRHSFAEDELAYLPDRKREYMINDDVASPDSGFSSEGRSVISNLEELLKDDKKFKRRGMLGWFKMRKQENLDGLSSTVDGESSASGSPASSSQRKVLLSSVKDGRHKPVSRTGNDPSTVESFDEKNQAEDLLSAAVKRCRLPATGAMITDQMDLLREQMKMLAGEVALSTSSLKRLMDQAARNPEDLHIKGQMQKRKDDISEKKLQMHVLEKRMIGSIETTPVTLNSNEIYQSLSKLATQLNEKTFELEIKSADNRILQEQLQMKISENAEMQETVLLLRQQLDSPLFKSSKCANYSNVDEQSRDSNGLKKDTCFYGDVYVDGNTPTSVMSLNGIFSQEDAKGCNNNASVSSQAFIQAVEVETLKQEKMKFVEEKDECEIHMQKLAEEASYAKELATAAAVELRNLAEEVTKLSYENAKLTGDLAAAKKLAHCRANCSGNQTEASLMAALSEKEHREGDLQIKLKEALQREEVMESELANMWVLAAKMRSGSFEGTSLLEGTHKSDMFQTRERNCTPLSSPYVNGEDGSCESAYKLSTLEEVGVGYDEERRRCKKLERVVSRLKGEDLAGLDIKALEELQDIYVEAITKICHAKCSTETESTAHAIFFCKTAQEVWRKSQLALDFGHDTTRAADPEEAEAIAVIRGMEAALSLGLDRIILLTDCQRLVRAFRDHSEDLFWGALTWAPDMYALAARFQTFIFEFVNRSCNIEAHLLAARGVISPPPFVCTEAAKAWAFVDSFLPQPSGRG